EKGGPNRSPGRWRCARFVGIRPGRPRPGPLVAARAIFLPPNFVLPDTEVLIVATIGSSTRTLTQPPKAWPQPLPPEYTRLSEPELRLRIQRAKETLGSRLVILGHHYQQDPVIDFADFVGDSFELSRNAAAQKGIEYVVFCAA